MSDGEVQGEAQVEQLDAVEATNAFHAVRPCLHIAKDASVAEEGQPTAEEIEAQEMGTGRTDIMIAKSTSHGTRDRNPS